MYRTCVHPDCTMPFDRCQIHHVVFRSRAGPTDVAYMVPLCTRGHDLVHHGGWTLAIDPDRTLTWTNPHGQTTTMPFVPLTELDRPPPDTEQPTLFHNPTAPAA